MFKILGEINAGKVGPSLMFSIPKYNNVSNIQTAFCSCQERTNDSDKSFTEQLKVSDNSTATFIGNMHHCIVPYQANEVFH